MLTKNCRYKEINTQSDNFVFIILENVIGVFKKKTIIKNDKYVNLMIR